jgi:hypothetical protein
MNRRTGVLTVLVACLLAAYVAWAYGFLRDQRAAAQADLNALEQCREAAARIEAIQRRPTMASDQERLAAEVTGRVEAAARSAGISGGGLLRIGRLPAQRVRDTVYKEKPTEVLLKDVTLPQLARLVHELVRGKGDLRAKSIRVRAPRQKDAGREWDGEVVLTYLIYDPPNTE